MGNLLAEYGPNEFQERVMGSVVLFEGMPHVTQTLDGDKVVSFKLTGTPEAVKKTIVHIPVSFFDGMASLQYPKLGYRSSAAGQYLAYFTKLPTPIKKGLHMGQHLHCAISNLTQMLSVYTDFNTRYFNQPEVRASMIFNPNFVSLKKGLEAIKAGEVLSFVVDNNFAVVPDNSKNGYLSIMYRERPVGSIAEDGKITLTSDWIKPAWDAVTQEKEGANA